MPASPHFILMSVYPSGMLITPVQQVRVRVRVRVRIRVRVRVRVRVRG